MTISHNVLALGALALTLSMTSCKDDDGGSGSVSKQKAQTLLNSFNTSTKTDLQNLSSTSGIETVQSFFDLTEIDDPFGRVSTDKKGVRKFLQEKSLRFKSIFAKSSTAGKTSADEPFDFNGNKGVY